MVIKIRIKQIKYLQTPVRTTDINSQIGCINTICTGYRTSKTFLQRVFLIFVFLKFPDCLSVRMLWTVSPCGSRTFCEGASTRSQCSPNRRRRRLDPAAHSEPRPPRPAATLASLKLTHGRCGGREGGGSVADPGCLSQI